MSSISDRILLGEKYSRQYISTLLPFVESQEKRSACAPTSLDAAVIRLRAYRLASDAGDENARKQLGQAILDTEDRLRCAPSDAFAWFLLFSLRSTRDKRLEPHLPLLGLSYQLGPNEGAFSPLRARAALPLVNRFGPGMLSYVSNEYAMIARDQVETAATIYVESSETTRTFLSQRLTELDEETRQTLLKQIERLDADAVPATALPRGTLR